MWKAFMMGLRGAAGPQAGAWSMGAMRAGMGVAGAWGTRTGKGAMIGAGAGGLWGAVSDDTSVLGGMVMGAGMGAVGGRYGGAGLRYANRGGAGLGFGAHLKMAGKQFGLGAYGQMRRDFRAVFGGTLRSNKAINPVRSTLRGTPAADLRRTVMAGATSGAAAPGRATSEALRRSPRTQQDLRLKMVEDIVAARQARVAAAGRAAPRGSLTPGMSSAEFAAAMGRG